MPPTLNPAWPGLGMSMAQGAFLYQPEALNEFSVLSYVITIVTPLAGTEMCLA